jgi:hypothetical protein
MLAIQYSVSVSKMLALGHTQAYISPCLQCFRETKRRDVGALNYVELLRSGCTTVMGLEESVEALAPFVKKLGIRSAADDMIGNAFNDRGSPRIGASPEMRAPLDARASVADRQYNMPSPS